MHHPLVIHLVNAGCRQAGPKILSDLSARVSDCCKDLRHWLKAKGWEQHPVAQFRGAPQKLLQWNRWLHTAPSNSLKT